MNHKHIARLLVTKSIPLTQLVQQDKCQLSLIDKNML